jgi:hypothetical protein
MRSQWRTVSVALTGMGCALAGLAIAAYWPSASASYPAFCGAIGFCVGAVAAKGGVQAHAEAKS